MPFDFKRYDAKCNGLTPEELQREWQHYTRLISGASTSTAISGLAVPLTMGVSTIGVAMSAPAIHNARKKRAIIEKHLQKHNDTHVTRKRDVFGSMAVSGTIGLVTMGVGTMGADAVATAGAEHGIAAVVESELAIKVVSHAAMDGVGFGIEHAHTSHLKKKDAVKAFTAAGVFKAVDNAKAAEAGYSIQPYNPQNFAPGGSMSQVGSPPPPPPYTPGSQRPPSYYPTPNHAYESDSKAPALYMQNSYGNESVSMANTGQYSVPQPYDPNQIQYQQVSQQGTPSTSTRNSISQPGEQYTGYGAYPTHLPQANHGFPSPPTSTYPQTTVQQVQQVQQMQSYQPQQSLEQYAAAKTQTPQELPLEFSPSGAYDMKSVSESLPTTGTEPVTVVERQKPQPLSRKPVPTSQAGEQPQTNQRVSSSISSPSMEHVEYFQDDPTKQVPEPPQHPVNESYTQSPSSTQQDTQLNQAPQVQPSSSQSSILQPTHESQRASQPTPQQYSSPMNQEPQVDLSSLCGMDLNAPQPAITQASQFHYGEVGMHSSPTTQQQLSHGFEHPSQATHQHKYHGHPEVIYSHQHSPGSVTQQQTGSSWAVPGQQTPTSTNQAQRYSLQPSLSPSPLLTPSPQVTPAQSQGIPYFPPPPGQPQNGYTPAAFSPPPGLSYSPAQPQRQSQKYATPEVQYPPVPIPGPYSSTARPTSFYGQISSPEQMTPPIPVYSKPQHAPPMQYHAMGYSQMPLTPPYSPPQVVQNTGSSYFPAGNNPQYQNMYPTQYQ